MDGKNLIFTGTQFRRLKFSVKSVGMLASNVYGHQVICIERFIVNSSFSS